MLTPANMFILGIIDARPVNPYEIVSRFEYNRYKAILNLADSSIYANIRAMYRKGFVQFEVQQEGGVPAKKIYSLTKIGKTELKETIRFFLSNVTSDPVGFSVALLLMHLFSKEELLSFLEKHKAAVEPIVREREADYEFTARTHKEVPCVPNVVSAFQVMTEARAKLETTCRTIEYLQLTETWPQSTFESDAEYWNRWLQEDLETRKYSPTPWGRPIE